jgi:iron complex outermembrane receptor protein
MKPYIQRKQPIALAVAAAVAMSCSYKSVLAQEGADDEEESSNNQANTFDEQVIVTERRATTESKTAISMEVLTAEDLASNQIVGFEDLQNEVPNLQFNTNGFGWAQANIRGVGNPSSGGPFEQVGVPIIQDGGAQGEEISLGGAMFDVGDVQVLRGPQGTFIGQSAAGGAILVTSARPNFDGVNGFVETELGTYDHEKITGAVNLPIGDRLAARISFLGSNQGSYYHNVASGFTPSGDPYGPGSSTDRQIRLGILWEPTALFTAYFKLESTDFRYIDNPATPSTRSYTGCVDTDADPLTPCDPVTTYSTFADGPGGESYRPNEPFEIYKSYPINATQENDRITVDLSKEFDNGMTFNSVTNYTAFYGVNGISPNSAAYATPRLAFLYGPGNSTVNQEFNVVSDPNRRFRWLAGVSYNDRFTNFEFSLPAGQGQNCGWTYQGTWSACSTVLPPATGYIYSNQETTQEDYGAFFQLNYDLSEELELTLGGRWNKNTFLNEELTTIAFSGFPFNHEVPSAERPVLCPGPGAAIGVYCPPSAAMYDYTAPGSNLRRYDDDIPTYRLGVNWSPGGNDDFIYAFAARGYKSGQPTLVARATGVSLSEPIKQEVVDSWEMGWKGGLGESGVYAELGFFYQDYTDMQLGAYTTTAIDSGAGTVNIGDVKIQGVESSLRADFGNFGLFGSLGYIDSELNGISSYESRALPNWDLVFPGVGDDLPIGDLSKGCVTSATQNCFDFSPFALQINGAQQLNAPELSYNLSVDYLFELNEGGTLMPRLSYRYADENYTSILQIPGENYYTRDKVEVFDLSVTYEMNDWTFQTFINNLTDEVYVTNAGGTLLFGDPRTAGVRARMTF